MFLGQFYHTIDEKGRMTIPAGFRDLFMDGAYITRGFDKNLRLLTGTAFRAMADKVSGLSETNPKIRKLRRHFFSNASRVEMDRLGRVLIPQFLRETAALENDVVIVGVGSAIEIWSPGTWQEQLEELSDTELTAVEFMEHDL